MKPNKENQAVFDVGRIVRQATLKALTLQLQGTVQSGAIFRTIESYAAVQAAKLTNKWMEKHEKRLQKLVSNACRKSLIKVHTRVLRTFTRELPDMLIDSLNPCQ